MKKLVLNRQDLIWERYKRTWTDKDWADFVASTKEKIETWEGADNSWLQYEKDLYELIKDLTWEDVVADFNKFEGKYRGEDCLYILDTSSTGTPYKVFLHEIIREKMQEEAYECGPYDSDYADDYEETFSVEG